MSLEKALAAAVEEKFEKKVKAKVKMRAQNAFLDCSEMAHSAIEQFYAAYTPTVYERKYSFYTSPQLTMKKINDLHYSIEIRFLDDLGGNHHDSDEYIYNRVIYAGIHGTSAIAMSTPIWEIFGSFLDFRFGEGR